MRVLKLEITFTATKEFRNVENIPPSRFQNWTETTSAPKYPRGPYFSHTNIEADVSKIQNFLVGSPSCEKQLNFDDNDQRGNVLAIMEIINTSWITVDKTLSCTLIDPDLTKYYRGP